MRNPGGDCYDHARATAQSFPENQENFTVRLRKDLSDAAGNIRSFFQNLFMGSKILYRDEDNQIREGKQRGLVRSLSDFLRNLGSALTLGLLGKGRDASPKGVAGRVGHALGKLREALLGDLVGGVSGSINHMGKNLLLAGWNLMEVVPDATIGNFDSGRKLTTAVFDNGQVLVEYITDVLPSGDAWFRVHAGSLRELKPPVLYNLSRPERYPQDMRWGTIRNTRFRKSIETVGALLADAAAMALVGQTGTSSGDSNRTP
ncbi:MAG: hypothetical protein GX443_11390 [Deltaproteobacteria bacterium]|nr:hypothetical protein [Deltaproteobacteria bacterium]